MGFYVSLNSQIFAYFVDTLTQFSLELNDYSESVDMYLTQKNQIRGLSKQEFVALQALCRLSKNMYNVGLYSVRQFYFTERQYLRYEANYHACKENENYKLLNTDIAQQTLKVVDRSFKSFFELIKKAQKGLYSF